jgi:nicotinamidase-related amidase
MNSKPALVVVDVQNGFVNDESRHVVPRIVELVRSWPGPIAFSRFWNREGSSYERLIGWSKLQGPPETDLVDELQPYASTVIDKVGYSFFSTEGAALAAKQGWSEVYFCGIDTDMCVLKSAVDAFELGLTPYVIADASASHAGLRAHEAGLYLLARFIGARQVLSGDVLGARASADARPASGSPPS